LNTIEQVKKALIAMTKSEKRVASFFLTQPSSFLYCTLDEIAETIGVSTTSVLRFCRKLDFDGFRAFQSQVRDENHHFPSLTDKYNRTAQNSEDALWEKSLGNTLSCIKKTFRELNHDTLKFTISSLLGARKVFTFGMKESFALAHYAFTRLQTVRTEVYLLENIHQGQIETLYGVIGVRWERRKGNIIYSISVPCGTEATLITPDKKEIILGSGEHEIIH
jgi:DNA-binding MurR/RpiR family transcriptional regulator